MERAKGEGNREIQQILNQMIFYAKYEHMMRAVLGLIGLPADSMGWCWKATQDHERAVLGACEGCLRYEGHAKAYRHADGPVFWPWLRVRTTAVVYKPINARAR